jgi:PAS domain S-box-containing protein
VARRAAAWLLFGLVEGRAHMTDVALSADPAVLRARIAQLEAELAAKPPIDRASLYGLADIFPSAIASLDPEGRFVFANLAMRAWLTGPAEPHETFFSIARPGLLEAARPMLSRALAGAPAADFVQAIGPAGDRRQLNITAAPRHSADGAVAGCILIVNDVTEERVREAAISQSEARIRLALDGSGVGIYDIDLVTGKGVWSASAFETLGLDPAVAEASYDTWRSTIHPDELAEVEASHAEAAAEGGRFRRVYRIVRADTGEARWLAAYGQFIHRDGRPVRSIGVVVDVTDQKRAEGLVRESERRLDLAVRAHRIGIFDWHVPSGRVIWSEQQEAIYGLPPGGFDGRYETWAARLLPDDRRRLERAFEAAMAARQAEAPIEFAFRDRAGEVRMIEGAARILYSPSGRPERMIGTNKDVTDRRLAEQRQQLLINELNHRVKNTLAIVQNIARQSLSGDPAGRAVRAAFEGRLTALSEAHNVLTKANWDSASIRRMIEVASAPHDPDGTRVKLRGPDLQLQPKTAVSLALAFHELATNAAKYGALGAPGGRVEIAWRVGDGRLRLSWRERDGPPVAAPAARGFGTRLLEKGLAHELGGEVTLAFAPAGVVCTIDAPLEEIAHGGAG